MTKETAIIILTTDIKIKAISDYLNENYYLLDDIKGYLHNEIKQLQEFKINAYKQSGTTEFTGFVSKL